MSRIGKMPIKLPDKIQAKLEGAMISIKGPKGELTYSLPKLIALKLSEKEIQVIPKEKSLESQSLWGTVRSLVDNMVIGVSVGFSKKLEFHGVGHKASIQGRVLNLNLGHSHPINYPLPKGIEAKVDKNIIEISGQDKELVGLVAAKVRSFRPPEPYKGKGVRYVGEKILMKAGKTGSKK